MGDTERLKTVIAGLLADRPVAYHPDIARISGGVKCAVFLCQFLYWTGKGARGDDFIWKTQAEIERETGLSRYEQEGARKKLVSLGLLEEKRAGIPATLHYRVNLEAIIEKLQDFYHEQECGKPPDRSAEKPLSIPENTPENTSKDSADAEEEITEAAAPIGEELLGQYFPRPEGKPPVPAEVGSWVGRMRERPWLGWSGGQFHPRAGISEEALERIGWLIEDKTGLRPVDGEWGGWLKACAMIYQVARGDWWAIEQGIDAVWGRKPQYRPGHARGFVDEVRKAAAGDAAGPIRLSVQ
jgi:hypothetical protein